MELLLKTNRLQISLVEPSDVESVHDLHLQPATDRFNTLGIPKSIGETQDVLSEWIEERKNTLRKHLVFKVELLEIKQFIGLIALAQDKPKFKKAEVWYKFHPNFWNNGYATEALKAIIKFGFENLQLHRIEAGCAVNNKGSIKVLEKVRMRREGRKRKVLPLADGWSDNYFYAILSSDQ